MKRNNVAKRIGIASLCLGVAVSAFSGISSFKNDSVVFAEDVQTTDFVTVSGATKAQEEVAVSTYNYTGLHISSDTTYSAEFNTVFSGNTTFKFRFPEYATGKIAGDFKFRITDVNDDSNYFDLVYYVIASSDNRGNNGTGVYAKYGNQIRTVQGQKNTMSNKKFTTCNANNYSGLAPYFNSYGGALAREEVSFREGVLSLKWSSGVLAVTALDGYSLTPKTRTVAKFDGTYDATATNYGFVAGTSWGLPKMSFPSGYKVSISSAYSTGTDVLFSSITTAGVTYDFTQETVTKGNSMKAYDVIKANTGKTLLGWKDTTGALHSTAAALASADIAAYTPVYLSFDTINGASARIESASKSGIRFMTVFNVDDYAAAKDYITSFGTLVAHTTTLNATKKPFTIDSYAGNAAFKQVVNNKGVFTYKDKKTGTTHIAYTMAIVDIAAENYTKEYSARGYIEVTYADETTQIFYTDYNAADNSRSIAQVAYLVTQDTTAYEALTDERKAIVDTYAAAYDVPEVA